MKSYANVECAHIDQSGKRCKELPMAHGVEKNRPNIQVSHPFVLNNQR